MLYLVQKLTLGIKFYFLDIKHHILDTMHFFIFEVMICRLKTFLVVEFSNLLSSRLTLSVVLVAK